MSLVSQLAVPCDNAENLIGIPISDVTVSRI